VQEGRGAGVRPGLLLDRDGVINEEVEYLHDPKDLVVIAGVAEAIATVNRLGIPVVVVSNQAGIGRGLYDVDAYRRVNQAIAGVLARRHARIDAWYFCPHLPDGNCACRKPRPGMLLAAAQELAFVLDGSVLVGDKASDLEAARAAGCRAVLVRTGYGRDAELGLAVQGRVDLVDHVAGSLHAALPWLLRAFAADVEQVAR
jgi:D-glycero-D-manno-heptose 1,7-bisphosphate phosphatase